MTTEHRRYRRRPNPNYLTVADIAEKYEFHPNTIYKWFREGLLRYTVGSRGEYLVRRDDLEKFFNDYYG